MKEINLKEILAKHISKRLLEHGNAREEVCNSVAKTSIDGGHYAEVIEAMKEACKQLLELAAENAKVKEDYIEDYYSLTYDGIEAHAIHKDHDGDPHSMSLFTVDKNSIINTINQVK